MEAWQETGGSSLLGKDLEPHHTILSRVRHCHSYIQCHTVYAHFTPVHTVAQKCTSGDLVTYVQLLSTCVNVPKDPLWKTNITKTVDLPILKISDRVFKAAVDDFLQV